MPLIKGDTIRVISPSWFGGDSFVPRAMRDVELPRSLGYQVEIGEHAFGKRRHVSGSVRERIEDFHAAFSAPHVTLVFSTIGGTHAAGLLVARPYGFDELQHRQFIGVLTERVSGYPFPVVANMDFGHTTPMMTMPLGLKVRIDPGSRSVRVMEPFANARRE